MAFSGFLNSLSGFIAETSVVTLFGSLGWYNGGASKSVVYRK